MTICCHHIGACSDWSCTIDTQSNQRPCYRWLDMRYYLADDICGLIFSMRCSRAPTIHIDEGYAGHVASQPQDSSP